MKFNDKLRNIRLQRGLTQTELAERLQTSQSSITSWENGRREPDFRTIQRLADFFNVPITALLPSDDTVDKSFADSLAESLHANPKLRMLFDKTRYLSNEDIDVILGVANAISKERNDD